MDAREQAIVVAALDDAVKAVILQYVIAQCDPSNAGEGDPILTALDVRRRLISRLELTPINPPTVKQ